MSTPGALDAAQDRSGPDGDRALRAGRDHPPAGDPDPALHAGRLRAAVGETGLDYHYDFAPKDAQAHSFRLHCEAARTTGLPLVVHTREADADTIAVLEDELAKGPFKGVIHCYSSSRALGERAVELGFHLGIGGVLTFPRSNDLRAIVRDLPLDRLILETDAPYLAPPPHRGRTNEPAYIPLVAEVLAKTKGETMAAVAAATTDAFFRLFPKAEIARSCG
jgi:TatD DNase family protein